MTSGSLCMKTALGCDTPPMPHVAGVVAFVTNPPERPVTGGRLRPLTGATRVFGTPHTPRRRLGCAGHPPLAWGRSRSSNPAREGQIRHAWPHTHGQRPPRPWPRPRQHRGFGWRVGDAPPRSGARPPSWKDCWLGVTPQRRGGWGCPASSSPVPIEACRNGGSLPATSKERGSAPALRWPWRNRQRARDIDDRGRVRPNGHFMSGDPQSEPDTQDQPPPPASGSHCRAGWGRTRPRRKERTKSVPEAGGTGAEAVATPPTPLAGHSADSAAKPTGIDRR